MTITPTRPAPASRAADHDSGRIDPERRRYPMPAPAHDPRFTYGLLIDVLDVLETHGYTRPTAGGDLVALQQALFAYLYALPGDFDPTDPDPTGGPTR